MFALLNVVLSFWQPAFHGLTTELTICISLSGLLLSAPQPLSLAVTCQSAAGRRVTQRQKECRTPAQLHILLVKGRNRASSSCTLQTSDAFFEDTP
jgi:hypothetical protein